MFDGNDTTISSRPNLEEVTIEKEPGSDDCKILQANRAGDTVIVLIQPWLDGRWGDIETHVFENVCNVQCHFHLFYELGGETKILIEN